MTVWKPISEAPEDILILLRKDFDSVETPMVVVGEVITFKGKKHHLFQGFLCSFAINFWRLLLIEECVLTVET